jgi:hypothetical protein
VPQRLQRALGGRGGRERLLRPEVEDGEPLLAGDAEEVLEVEHLVQRDAERPHVHLEPDGLAPAHVAHLGRAVLRGGVAVHTLLLGGHRRIRAALDALEVLRARRAEVAQLPQPVFPREYEVLGLDVAVRQRLVRVRVGVGVRVRVS